MKKAILGILLGMAILGQPVQCRAADAVFPRTHEVTVNEFSYDDAQLLMKIAEAEAGNQGMFGKWLVMCCVVNRANSDSELWPDTISAVISQPFQFYAEGIGKTEISPEAHEALARIEMGDVAPQIVAFEKSSSKELDKYFMKAFEYKDHTFYTLANN